MRPAMRALLRVFMILVCLPITLVQAGSPQPIASLPPPVRDYAAALKPYCAQIGREEVVVNRIYSDHLFGLLDVNTDGQRDYIVYKCMFGCNDEPYALQGMGPHCMFGSLLLSSAIGYRSIPVPGQLLGVEKTPRLRVAVHRAHIHPQDCGGHWYCNYVFELRQDWFRLVGPCPPKGCRILLSAIQQDDGRQASTAQAQGD